MPPCNPPTEAQETLEQIAVWAPSEPRKRQTDVVYDKVRKIQHGSQRNMDFLARFNNPCALLQFVSRACTGGRSLRTPHMLV